MLRPGMAGTRRLAGRESAMGTERPFLRKVRVRNYKSIGQCQVDLKQLTVLVGRNGSGKSNFLDALRFIADALQTTLDRAIKMRGGIGAVRRKSTGHPRNFGIELDLTLAGSTRATFGFEIAARSDGGFAVRRERLQVKAADGRSVGSYEVENGTVKRCSESAPPQASRDRLYLVSASGLPIFRPVFDGLSSMGFYNLNPEAMKDLHSPDAGELLHRDGANIASVVGRLARERPEVMERLSRYLGAIVPGMVGVERITLGPKETLELRQEVEGAQHPWRFYAVSVSDGTLRTLGILAAVMQLAGSAKSVPLVGIEEPETALHPAAAGALMDALKEASVHTQVVVTSHSGVLLDELDLSRHGLLVVSARRARTEIAGPDEASLEAIREHLYTPGELQRIDQLEADERSLEATRQFELFAET